MNIIGLIPARGGSKGLPGKNIRPLCGKPLIAWTIQDVLASRYISRCYVSTDDSSIATVARGYGAEVLDRPKDLGAGYTSMTEVMQHALTLVEADVVVLLQCTCPIRDKGLIDRCIEALTRENADSAVAGFDCMYMAYASDVATTGHELQRQDYSGFFYDSGSVYVIRAELLRSGDRYGQHHAKVYIDKEQQVDIDDEFDFWLAEQIMKKRGVRS